jgi:putative salt-induced outer membrane protein YdiY
MKKLFAFAAAALLGAGMISSARADDVILTEGEHLIGTITKVEDGKMFLHSEVLKDIVIPLDHVKTFSTSAPIELHLADGSVLKRELAESDPGQVAIVGDGLGQGQKLNVADIETVNPQPFTGSFLVGGTLVRGNTFTDTVAAGFNLGYKVKQEQLTFTGEYDYGNTKDRTTNSETTTVDRWDLYGKYQHFFTKKFYFYADSDVTKDRIADLDLRFTPSAGVGYQWFDKKPFNFGTEGGFAWLYETYTNGTPTREEVSLKLAYHLTYDFNPMVTLFHDLTYYPSIEYGSHYLINADIGLHAKLTKQLFAELKIEWDYDSTPALNALKNDARYIGSIGYSL